MLLLILGPSSLTIVAAQPDERHANKTASVLEWYDRYRALTSGSNEEANIEVIRILTLS